MAAAISLATPAVASAAESPMPTAQATAYGMDWVPYIDPADLPPVEQRKVVCLVDSGVEINPDLPPDRPEGPIVARHSTDGGSGLPGDKPEHAHGTTMASVAGAVPENDWGTVGAWPAVRIISMRAMAYDRTTFAPGDWRRGVQECTDRSASGWPVAAINLSFGSPEPLAPQEQALLAEYVARAHAEGASVLAAAGNNQGELESPANVEGILPIAAGDTTSAGLCPYASYAPAVLVGPGCGLDFAIRGTPLTTDSGGSSAATMFASTLVGLLRTLRPGSSWQQAENWLRQGAQASSGRPLLNGEGAARAAGLGGIVDRARERMRTWTAVETQAPTAESSLVTSAAPATPSDAVPPAPLSVRASEALRTNGTIGVGTADHGASADRLPRVKALVRWRKSRLTVTLRRRPEAAERLRVVVTYGRGGRQDATSRRVTRRVIHLPLPRRPSEVSLQFLPIVGDSMKPSHRTVLRGRRGGVYA